MYLWTYDLYGPVRNSFDADKSIARASGRGLGLGLCSLPFQGPKKSWFSGPTPFNSPRNGSCPHQNHYVPRHINNRYINSYSINPCCGSGSVCFWASRTRIRIRLSQVRIRLRTLPSSSKNSEKKLDFYCFVTSLNGCQFPRKKIIPSYFSGSVVNDLMGKMECTTFHFIFLVQ